MPKLIKADIESHMRELFDIIFLVENSVRL